MKIDRVEAFPLSCTLPRPVGDGKGLQAVRQVLLVRVTTDEGAVGWGEGGPAVLGALQVRHAAASALLGADPTAIDPLYDRLRHAGLGGGVLGAVDMALWDLAGHIQGRSVAEMLGGVRWSRVPAYASLHNYSETADLTDEWTELIQSARERGFRDGRRRHAARTDRTCDRLGRFTGSQGGRHGTKTGAGSASSSRTASSGAATAAIRSRLATTPGRCAAASSTSSMRAIPAA